MSERTKALDDVAIGWLRVMMDGSGMLIDGAARGERATRAFSALKQALVAQVEENLTGELATIRRLCAANPGESTYKAVKRIVWDRESILAKYRAAQKEWREHFGAKDTTWAAERQALIDDRNEWRRRAESTAAELPTFDSVLGIRKAVGARDDETTVDAVNRLVVELQNLKEERATLEAHIEPRGHETLLGAAERVGGVMRAIKGAA